MCFCSGAECTYYTVFSNEMGAYFFLLYRSLCKYGLSLCLVLFKELSTASFEAVEMYATDLCSTWGQMTRLIFEVGCFFQNVAENIWDKV